MIISRSPLRISLGGGGTDLSSYYEKRSGYVLAAAIDKYVYCSVNTPFSNQTILKYSEIEKVSKLEEIQHPIIRECLKLFCTIENKGIEIASVADLPAGTGLGSSGSFTTALLKALSTYFLRPIHARELAELACRVEIEILNEPIGKQDQYIAAHGGFTEFVFEKNGDVLVSPLELSEEIIHDLEDNLLLYYTGISRSASEILKEQHARSSQDDLIILDHLDKIKEIGIASKKHLLNGDMSTFAALMNEHWDLKKSRSKTMSSGHINDAYSFALKNGALGGKLVGAGGGGFLLFYATDREKLRNSMRESTRLEEVRFKFDFEGTKVVMS